MPPNLFPGKRGQLPTLLAELGEQQGLREDVVLQAGQRDRLVGAVCVGLRILRAGDEHLRGREDALQLRDERDRATLALVDRRHAERLLHGRECILGGDRVRVHRPAHAVLQLGDLHLGAERGVCLQERGKRVLRLLRVLARRGAQGQTERGLGADHVE